MASKSWSSNDVLLSFKRWDYSMWYHAGVFGKVGARAAAHSCMLSELYAILFFPYVWIAELSYYLFLPSSLDFWSCLTDFPLFYPDILPPFGRTWDREAASQAARVWVLMNGDCWPRPCPSPKPLESCGSFISNHGALPLTLAVLGLSQNALIVVIELALKHWLLCGMEASKLWSGCL